MNMSKKLAAFATGFALLMAPLTGAAANKLHHRHFAQRTVGCPVHRIADGSLVDCHGWRKWSGSIGWDNSCFNLDYLSSEFACSSRGRR